MATEIAAGGQAALDAFARMRDSSLPIEDRYDASFTDHDPAAGQPAGPSGPVRNVQVLGFNNGKAPDRLGSTDELGILQQLGLT